MSVPSTYPRNVSKASHFFDTAPNPLALRDPPPPPLALRHEAQTVLMLFKKRREDLDACDAVRDPEVTTFGMLMILPHSKGSATLQKVQL
jgi:hypothetical protein